MANETKFLEALKKLREEDDKRYKKRNFDQTIDLIVNLKEFDVRKHSFNLIVTTPNKIRNKKVAGFFEKDSELVDTIKKDDFIKYREKKDSKKLVKSYDFFIANAKLMPAVATGFGRVLGPAGKMPNPQLGVLLKEEEPMIKALLNKINSSVKIVVKEPSIKVGIGKQSLTDEQVIENVLSIYNKILELLPKGIENVKNIKLKFTMTKPVQVSLK